MEIIKTVKDMQTRSNKKRRLDRIISFVPTMGFLHEGHLTLLREGKKRGDDLVLSIFVNPAQFGPNEDLDAYPRNLEKDLKLAENEGVDVVFTPTKEQLYGDRYQTYVKLENLPDHLCGLSRPVHFRGVATVVTKLFNIVKPHVALFGEKDFQQLAVIRQMVKDLNFDIDIVGVATVREKDGLAMSSRNTYLSSEERSSALSLSKALQMAQERVLKGDRDTSMILNDIRQFIESHPGTTIDYATICDPGSLEDMTVIDTPALFALAVMVGKTRLIDNKILNINA
ncbi:MAG: pantoate--beta-alanine ligase [Proteobacteria bacterium]|nr:pantoate--beta-alanine ligase [Pseudomonadota bacterium]